MIEDGWRQQAVDVDDAGAKLSPGKLPLRAPRGREKSASVFLCSELGRNMAQPCTRQVLQYAGVGQTLLSLLGSLPDSRLSCALSFHPGGHDSENHPPLRQSLRRGISHSAPGRDYFPPLNPAFRLKFRTQRANLIQECQKKNTGSMVCCTSFSALTLPQKPLRIASAAENPCM